MSRSASQPVSSLFQTANLLQRKAIHKYWHRRQSQCYILPNQLGFECAGRGNFPLEAQCFHQVDNLRPVSCQGCVHYHGKYYGQNRATRTLLVCGFHPYGWTELSSCPDWQKDNLDEA